MPSKKKSKKRSSVKSAKKVRRGSKGKTSRKPVSNQVTRKRVSSTPKRKTRKKSASVSAEKELKREFQNRNLTGRTRASARQSEDFEGVSRAELADSESVDELVEEGNLFEAGAVAGVQEADDADEREVHTHELPEDDVPREYTDKD
jgi:N utilization substance protein A